MTSAKNDIIGKRFGRLVVIGDVGKRSSDGSVLWECQCDCGNLHYAVSGNLKSGSVQSCKCLQKELSGQRRRDAKKPPKKCSVEGCENTTEKGGSGFCGMHYMRFKRYGDVNYITPEEDWRKLCRYSQPLLGQCKQTTYKKNLGRHEHRVVMEKIIGRPLKSDELVHHIDGNQHNNDPSNLQLVSHEEHARIHFTKDLSNDTP